MPRSRCATRSSPRRESAGFAAHDPEADASERARRGASVLSDTLTFWMRSWKSDCPVEGGTASGLRTRNTHHHGVEQEHPLLVVRVAPEILPRPAERDLGVLPEFGQLTGHERSASFACGRP